MASNVAKVGRLPPIADLGLGQLPQKKHAEIAVCDEAISIRGRRDTGPYSDKNLLLRQTDYAEKGLESDEKEKSGPMIHDIIEKAMSKQKTKGSRRKGQKSHSQFDSSKLVNDTYLQNSELNDKMQESHMLEEMPDLPTVTDCSKTNIEEGSGTKWHQHSSHRMHPYASKGASELADGITVSGSLSIDSSNGLDRPSRVDYRELAVRLASSYSKQAVATKRKRSFVDYILVFSRDDESEFNENQRQKFESLLKAEGIDAHRSHFGNHVYVELCCSFERLCEEAEAIFLEMPLIGVSIVIW